MVGREVGREVGLEVGLEVGRVAARYTHHMHALYVSYLILTSSCSYNNFFINTMSKFFGYRLSFYRHNDLVWQRCIERKKFHRLLATEFGTSEIKYHFNACYEDDENGNPCEPTFLNEDTVYETDDMLLRLWFALKGNVASPFEILNVGYRLTRMDLKHSYQEEEPER